MNVVASKAMARHHSTRRYRARVGAKGLNVSSLESVCGMMFQRQSATSSKCRFDPSGLTANGSANGMPPMEIATTTTTKAENSLEPQQCRTQTKTATIQLRTNKVSKICMLWHTDSRCECHPNQRLTGSYTKNELNNHIGHPPFLGHWLTRPIRDWYHTLTNSGKGR